MYAHCPSSTLAFRWTCASRRPFGSGRGHGGTSAGALRPARRRWRAAEEWEERYCGSATRLGSRGPDGGTRRAGGPADRGAGREPRTRDCCSPVRAGIDRSRSSHTDRRSPRPWTRKPSGPGGISSLHGRTRVARSCRSERPREARAARRQAQRPA